MPRLRPAPLKTKEEIAKVPLTEPVDLELEDKVEELPHFPFENGKGKTQAITPEKPIPVVEQEKPVDLPEVSDLQKQLESLTKAEKLARDNATEQTRLRQDAERREQERTQEVTQSRGEAEQAKYDAIVNAMAASQAEAESAKKELKTAGESQDWGAMAEAQEKISRANARLVNLEDGKSAYEQKREEAKTAKSEIKSVASDPLEAHIAQIAVNDGEKNWLRSHKDFLIEPRKNAKLGAAHYDAEDAGHRRGSDGYIQFIEERLGLREPVKKAEEEVETETQRSPTVSAPVSREAPSVSTGKPSSTRITLTPEQRESAKISGISEIEYARNLLKYNDLKSQGYYKDQ